jgi:hypothetical protein
MTWVSVDFDFWSVGRFDGCPARVADGVEGERVRHVT